MSIPPGQVKAGTCYLMQTRMSRIRRVDVISSDSVVHFKSRRDVRAGFVWIPGTQSLIGFAAGVEREVLCDWTPEMGRGAAVSILPESIRVDQCYLTEGGSIRKVTLTGSDGWVRYRERVAAGPWPRGRTEKLKRHAFAAAVVREIACDWIPDTDEGQP